MKKFLSVTQSKTARFHSLETDSKIQGLYTDNFSECNLFVFKKQYADHTRISLTHADRLTSSKFIQEEMAWVGDDCEKIILRKNSVQSSSDVTKMILSSAGAIKRKGFQIQNVDPSSFGIGVDGAQVHVFSRDTIPELACHPLEWVLHNHYTLNSLIDTESCRKSPASSLIFDGKDWIDIDANQFENKPRTQMFFSEFSKKMTNHEHPSFTMAKIIVRDMTQTKYRDLNDETGISMIALALEVIVTQNNIQAMFERELRFLNHYIPETQPNQSEMQMITEVIELMSGNLNQALNYTNQHKSEMVQNIALRSIVGMASICKRLQKQSETLMFKAALQVDEEKSPTP